MTLCWRQWALDPWQIGSYSHPPRTLFPSTIPILDWWIGNDFTVLWLLWVFWVFSSSLFRLFWDKKEANDEIDRQIEQFWTNPTNSTKFQWKYNKLTKLVRIAIKWLPDKWLWKNKWMRDNQFWFFLHFLSSF